MNKKPKQAELISDVEPRELEELGFQFENTKEVDSQFKSLVKTDRKLVSYTFEANSRKFGRKLIVLDTVPTTMDLVDDLAKAGQMEDGDALIALEQTHGLGKNGRVWVSERGNLHVNVFLDGSQGVQNFSMVMAALASNATVREFGVEQSGIKWVNDILVKNRKGHNKIAGILTRGIPILDRQDGKFKDFANVGIGLNLNTFPKDVAIDQFVTGVTTLQKETQQEISLAEVTDILLQNLAKQFLEMRLGNRQEVMWNYNDQLVGKGEMARLDDDMNGKVEAGKFLGANEYGFAKMVSARQLKEFFSGRLEIVR